MNAPMNPEHHEQKAAENLAHAGRIFDAPPREEQWAKILGALAHAVLALSMRLGQQDNSQRR